MPFLGVLVLISALAQHAPSDDPSRQRSARPVPPRAVWDGSAVPLCKEDFRPPARPLRLIEVPDGPTQLADATGGLPGWVPDVPQTCVMPAR